MNHSVVKKITALSMVLLSACVAQAPSATGAFTPAVNTDPPTTEPAAANTAFSTPSTGPRMIASDNLQQIIPIRQLGLAIPVGYALFSPDGGRLYQASLSGIYVFDGDSFRGGLLLIPLDLPEAEYPFLAVSPDGKTLAVGGNLFAAEDGCLSTVLEEHPDPEITGQYHYDNPVAFSPDGSLIAVVYAAGVESETGLWRLSDGKFLYAHYGESPGFADDGRMLATVYKKGDVSRVDLYDAVTGGLMRSWPGERFAFLPEGRLAVEHGGSVAVFDPQTGETLQVLSGRFAAFSPDGRLAVMFSNGRFTIQRVADRQVVGELEGDFSDVETAQLSFAPDGGHLVGKTWIPVCCGGDRGSGYLWSMPDGGLIAEDISGFSPNFSPDGRYMGTVGRIACTADGSIAATLEGFTHSRAGGLAFLPDGGQLAVSYDNEYYENIYEKTTLFYRIRTGDLERSLTGVTFSEISPDGRYAVTSNNRIWRISDGREVDAFNLDIRMSGAGPVHAVALAPDGNRLAVGRENGELEVWDSHSMELLRREAVCTAPVGGLSFSPDGRRLAVACSVWKGSWRTGTEPPQVVLLQSNDPGGESVVLDLHGGWYWISRIVYSPDGKHVAIYDGDRLALWDTETVMGKGMVHIGSGDPANDILDFAFSPDGSLCAVSWRNGGIDFWEVVAGRKIFSVADPTTGYRPPSRLAFSPDGEFLAVAYGNGPVQLYGIG